MKTMREFINCISESVLPYQFNSNGSEAKFIVPRVVKDEIEVLFTEQDLDLPGIIRIDFDSSLYGENNSHADAKSAFDIFQTVSAVVMDFYNKNKNSILGFAYEAADESYDQRMKIYHMMASKIIKKISSNLKVFHFTEGKVSYVIFADALLALENGEYVLNMFVDAYGEPQ